MPAPPGPARRPHWAGPGRACAAIPGPRPRPARMPPRQRLPRLRLALPGAPPCGQRRPVPDPRTAAAPVPPPGSRPPPGAAAPSDPAAPALPGAPPPGPRQATRHATAVTGEASASPRARAAGGTRVPWPGTRDARPHPQSRRSAYRPRGSAAVPVTRAFSSSGL